MQKRTFSLSSRFVVLLLGYKIQDFRRFVNRKFFVFFVIFAKSAAAGGLQALFWRKIPRISAPVFGKIMRNRETEILEFLLTSFR